VQQHDYTEIEQALAAFMRPGDVFEVRLIHSGRKRIDAGYFDHPAHAATAICGLQESYQGIYFTPNPVAPDLAARAYNRINPWAQLTTQDPDILERRWLLIDIDPIRPTGISSTDAELDNAFKVARRLSNMLELEGWPRPLIGASGNGCHLEYAIQEPNTEFVRDEISKLLKCLNARFKGDGCEIDTTVFNAARIWRIPGTWARKGDSTATRPHRKSHVISKPDELVPVLIGTIAKFNAKYESMLPAPAKAGAAKNKAEYPDDERKYRGLNEQAMNRLKEWVPILFPAAREYKQGYRVSSDELGLSFEEDLTIHPWPLGIKYFGIADQGDYTEGRRTPVALVAELLYNGDKELAARKLSDILKAPLTEFDALPPPVQALKLPGAEPAQALYDFSRVPSIADLQKRTFKPIKWVIPDVLPVGAILLAARPKMRKTFLALQLSIAITAGRKFLNWQCEQGDVLFLGLEDNERRLRSRIKLLQSLDLNPPDLSGFRYWTGGVDINPAGQQFISNPEEAARTLAAFPKGQAGVDALNTYMDMYPKTRMIVVDTLARWRDTSTNRDIYQRDYDQMMPLTQFANDRQVLVLVVHHEKKGLASADTGDFMEDVSGSSGITGAVDGVMSIKGKRGTTDENEARKLLLSGRDIPRDFDVDIAFDAQRGGWLTAARQDVQEAIKALLGHHPYLNQQELAALLPNTSRSRISQVLTQLKFDGLVVQNRFGYSLAKI